MTVRVQTDAFDPGQELNALHAANLGIGAVVVLQQLTLSHLLPVQRKQSVKFYLLQKVN